MFESLSRLANNIENGRPPVCFPQPGSSPIEQLDVSQDYLTMQTLFGMAVRPNSVKSERYYPVTAGGIPFVMNSSFAISPNENSNFKQQQQQSLPYQQTTNMYNNCTPSAYPPKQMIQNTKRV